MDAFESLRNEFSGKLDEINQRLQKLEKKQETFEKSEALKKKNSYNMIGSGCVFIFSHWECSMENGKREWTSSSCNYKYKADGGNSNLIFYLKGENF